MANSVLNKAASGVGYLIGFQFISRVATFLLNLFVVRKVAPEVFGVGNIHLQLYLNVVYLLSREAFRRAITRSELKKNTKENQSFSLESIVRIIWCVVPVGIIVAFIIWSLALLWRSEEELQMEQYESFMRIMFFSVVIEILTEPFWIMMQMLFLIKQRVGIEASAMVARCIVIFLCVFTTNAGLLSFSFGQMAYSVVLFVGFLRYFVQNIQYPGADSPIPFTRIREIFPTLPKSIQVPQGTTREKILLVFTFSWQSIQKLLLQESEKIVLKFTNTLLNLGIFSVVSNLGSLVARFLFQPVEEICFTLFSKLITDTTNIQKKEKAQNIVLCSKVLFVVLKLMIFIGLIFICFGMNYSTALLELLYGEKYGRQSTAPTVLAVYCISVAFMAVNGITESFFSAAASSKDLRNHNFMMIGFSVLYISSCIVLVDWFSTPGLVIANCINMGARILFSAHFINKFLYSQAIDGVLPRKTVLPNTNVIILFVVSYVITFVSEHYFTKLDHFTWDAFIFHVVIGSICFFATLFVTYLFEKDFVKNLRELTKQKTQ